MSSPCASQVNAPLAHAGIIGGFQDKVLTKKAEPLTRRAFDLLKETEDKRGNYNMYDKFCGGRIPEGHRKLSFSKYVLSVYCKQGKALGTGDITANIPKTKTSSHDLPKEGQESLPSGSDM